MQKKKKKIDNSRGFVLVECLAHLISLLPGGRSLFRSFWIRIWSLTPPLTLHSRAIVYLRINPPLAPEAARMPVGESESSDGERWGISRVVCVYF